MWDRHLWWSIVLSYGGDCNVLEIFYALLTTKSSQRTKEKNMYGEKKKASHFDFRMLILSFTPHHHGIFNTSMGDATDGVVG